MAELNIVEGLIVQPGDTLLVRLDPARATAVYADKMRELLEEYLPDGVRVAIVAADGFALATPKPPPADKSWIETTHTEGTRR